MSLAVARKVKELVAAGATVYGPKPTQSPSLTGYPSCDSEVSRIGDDLWGASDPKQPTYRRFRKGMVVSGALVGNVLRSTLAVPPDFHFSPATPGTNLSEIHRKIGDADVYFVSNQRNRSCLETCTFRVTGRIPELWHPETGQVEECPAFTQTSKVTSIQLSFDPAESLFVVFRKPAPKVHMNLVLRETDPKNRLRTPTIVIDKARYESEDGHGADVTEVVRGLVTNGAIEIPATNSNFGDTAVNLVKHLTIEYRIDGKPRKETAPENDSITLRQLAGSGIGPKPFTLRLKSAHEVAVTSWEKAQFSGVDSGGLQHTVSIGTSATTIPLSGAWHVSFPPNMGAPNSAEFSRLISWPDHLNPGIKYFSGSATYSKSFQIPKSIAWKSSALRLNLGEVKNFATVTLNGKEVAVLWKPPFTLDVTGYVHPGENNLQVKVTNLWPNRIIGDEQLPPDVEWDGDHLKKWPDWLLQGKPRPKTGRVTFETWHFYDKNSPLLESGLLGPVTIQATKPVTIRY
jgi:hypothetical protein